MTRDPAAHAARIAEHQASWNQNKSQNRAHPTITALIGLGVAGVLLLGEITP